MTPSYSTYRNTGSKSREEIEKTHRIVNVVKHCGHEIAFTVSRFRSHEDYLKVLKQSGRSVQK